MAKYGIRIPLINPTAISPEYAIHWYPIFRSNNIDDTVSELADFLLACFPCDVVFYFGVSPAEEAMFKNAMQVMEGEVRGILEAKGIAMPPLNMKAVRKDEEHG